MKGIALTFSKQIATGADALNNQVSIPVDIVVDDCLIAPISEPTNAREQQAMEQSRDQLRIHLPKSFTGDISDSDIVWGGKRFHIDSESVVFMAENTPTRWNRYFRAEFVDNYSTFILDLISSFVTEDGDNYFTTENNNYFFSQEVVL